MHDPAAELAILAGKLVRQLRRSSAVPKSYRVLATLDDIGPAGVSQLAVADGISQPTMSNLVADLVAEGYVAKEPHPTDARAQVVSLTDAGRRYLLENRARITSIVRGRLSDHSEAEVATAIAVLKSLTEKGTS